MITKNPANENASSLRPIVINVLHAGERVKASLRLASLGLDGAVSLGWLARLIGAVTA